MTCVQPLGLSLCGEAFPSSNPTQLQAPAMRTEPRSPSLPEVCNPETIPYGIPYRTRRSIRNSEVAYGILESGFAAEIPGRKSLMECLLTIQSRYRIASETPIAIRIPYGIGNPPPKIIAARSGRLPEPNLPSFLGDILPFPNTKRSDEVKAKPLLFRLIAANGHNHAPSRADLATSYCCHDPPFCETKSHNSFCTEEPPTMRQ